MANLQKTKCTNESAVRDSPTIRIIPTSNQRDGSICSVQLQQTLLDNL